MTDDDLIEAIRESRGDKRMAFVRLERKFRDTLNKRLSAIEDGSGYEAWNSFYIEYMNHTLAAATAFGIDAFTKWKLPSHSINHSLSDSYRDFCADIDNYSIQVRLANAEHQSNYAVYLSNEDKRKIRHFADQIKETIDNSKIAIEKREELLDLLNSFLKELDRDRTRMEVVGALVVGYAHIVGDAVKELEPIRPWIDSIAKIFGKAQEDQPKSLPKPDTKQIEGPPREEPAPQKRPTVDDDEIPF